MDLIGKIEWSDLCLEYDNSKIELFDCKVLEKFIIGSYTFDIDDIIQIKLKPYEYNDNKLLSIIEINGESNEIEILINDKWFSNRELKLLYDEYKPIDILDISDRVSGVMDGIKEYYSRNQGFGIQESVCDKIKEIMVRWEKRVEGSDEEELIEEIDDVTNKVSKVLFPMIYRAYNNGVLKYLELVTGPIQEIIYKKYI